MLHTQPDNQVVSCESQMVPLRRGDILASMFASRKRAAISHPSHLLLFWPVQSIGLILYKQNPANNVQVESVRLVSSECWSLQKGILLNQQYQALRDETVQNLLVDLLWRCSKHKLCKSLYFVSTYSVSLTLSSTDHPAPLTRRHSREPPEIATVSNG